MPVDLSSISYFLPLLVYLLVAVVIGALMIKFKILGESKGVSIFLALFIATIFISAASVRQYVTEIVPWFAVFVIILFFLLFLIAFVGKNAEFMTKGVGVAVVVLAVLAFVFVGVRVFGYALEQYMPGGSSPVSAVSEWIIEPKVLGAILLLAVSGLAAWIVTKK